MAATDEAIALAQVVAQAAADKLAQDIVLIDVSERLAITDVFVVATGTNERQVEAIVDAVEERARAAGAKPIRREGQRDGRWVLLDYGDVVVHIQHAETRVFYALERLWKDCPFLPFVDRAGPDRDGSPAGPDARADAAASGTATSATSAAPATSATSATSGG